MDDDVDADFFDDDDDDDKIETEGLRDRNKIGEGASLNPRPNQYSDPNMHWNPLLYVSFSSPGCGFFSFTPEYSM